MIDYNKITKIPGPYIVDKTNSPLDGRLIINEESEITDIYKPYIGLIVYSKNDNKYFKNYRICLYFLLNYIVF